MCCAKKALARPANAALPLIASAVCAPLAKANSCNSMAALTTHDWLEGRGPVLPRRNHRRLFPPAAALAPPLRRPHRFLR